MLNRQNARVLIVEDEPLIAMNAEAMIADLGYEVLAAVGTVELALKALTQRRPDIVLLDLLLGSDSGLPVAERCRRLGIRVIFATGLTILPDGWGDTPVITKPYLMEDLRLTLQRLAGAVRS
jgi:CheY-like chemotaxis protein